MSGNIQMNENDIIKHLGESDLSLSAVSSKGIIEPHDDDRVLLKYSPSRALFLTRVAMLFVVFFGMVNIMLLWKTYHSKSFYHWVTLFNLERNWKAVLAVLIFDLLFNGFFGFIWKGFLHKVVLATHWLVQMAGVMIFLILFEDKLPDPLQLNPYLIRLLLGLAQLNTVVFLLSTLVKDNKNIFRAWSSFWAQNFANWIYLYLVPRYFDVPNYGFYNYLRIAAFSFFINIYITLNANFIVNYRTTKFYDDEEHFCYFAFWIDWFSYFWIDVFRTRGKRTKMSRMFHLKKKIDEKKRKRESEVNQTE